jgi:hypothetical protein
MDWTIDPRQRQRIFPLASVSRPALGPTQPPVQWLLEVLSLGVIRGRGVTLTTHPHLVPTTWMSRSYTSSPSLRLCRCVVGLLYLSICLEGLSKTTKCPSEDSRSPVRDLKVRYPEWEAGVLATWPWLSVSVIHSVDTCQCRLKL